MTFDEFMYDHDVDMIYDLLFRDARYKGLIDEQGKRVNEERQNTEVQKAGDIL